MDKVKILNLFNNLLDRYSCECEMNIYERSTEIEESMKRLEINIQEYRDIMNKLLNE